MVAPPGGPKHFKASDRQEAGHHYAHCDIQPIDYALANDFNYWESAALKYLTRHRDKNGAEDLRKLIHCIQLGLEREYGE